MKRLILSVLSLGMIISFSGCGSDSTTETPVAEIEPTVETPVAETALTTPVSQSLINLHNINYDEFLYKTEYTNKVLWDSFSENFFEQSISAHAIVVHYDEESNVYNRKHQVNTIYLNKQFLA